MTPTIKHAVDTFIKLKMHGWQTELAFNACYDTVYDEISAEEFLNFCQAAAKHMSDLSSTQSKPD